MRCLVLSGVVYTREPLLSHQGYQQSAIDFPQVHIFNKKMGSLTRLATAFGIFANLWTLSGAAPTGSPFEGTDANLLVYNDFINPLPITVDGNELMSNTFPSQTIQPGQSASGYIKASWWPGQSSFVFHEDQSHQMLIDIGQAPFYITSANPSYFPDFTGAVVQAPGKPFSEGTDYEFYFFNGPGSIPPLINSVIAANLPAIQAYVAKNPLTIKIPNDFFTELTLTSVNINVGDLYCVYTALTPKSGTIYNANVVCKLNNGGLSGDLTLSVGDKNVSFNISVTDATLFVQIQLDASFATKPSITALKCSLGNYDASGDFINELKDIPGLQEVFQLGASPYRVAGLVNNNFNSQIINAINDALSNVNLKARDGVFKSLTSILARASASQLQPMSKTRIESRASSNLSTWMSTPAIQNKTLGQIKLAGTHDSATYGLTTTLSQVEYDDISFLWALSNQSAPADGTWPIPSKPTPAQPIYLGDALYQFVMADGVKAISQTQDRTTLQQLQDGIRSFDLRVYYDTRDGQFYTQHALRGPALTTILSDVKTFIEANSNAAELIFLAISHNNLADHTDKISQLTGLIKGIIPQQNIYWQPTPQGQSQFDFQSLNNTKLSAITNGSTKVMFLNQDTDYSCPDTVTNTQGYAGIPWTGEVYSEQAMAATQGPALKTHTQPLWSFGWNLGLSNNDIAASILRYLRAGGENTPLKDVTTPTNGALPGFFAQYGTNVNLISLDWYDFTTASQSVLDLIVGLNGQ